MKYTHALVAAGVGAVATVGMAVPAQAAAPAAAPVGAPCTYTVDEVARTISGSCDFGPVDATFAGSFSGTTATGTFTLTTWWGNLDGTFSGTGFQDGGRASGTYSVRTWWGATYTGSFGATER